MAAVLFILGVLAWVTCGLSGYPFLKAMHREQFPSLHWTKGDRLMHLLFAAAAGPAWLLATLIQWIGGDAPASW